MPAASTPIETYKVKGHTIYVKREDLCFPAPYPPLAKLRGARLLLERLRREGWRHIGVYDTRVSMAGWGIAVLCTELGLRCTVGVPLREDAPLPPQQLMAQSFGAKIIRLRPAMASICYARFKKTIESEGGFVLPMGLACQESVEAVAAEASTVPVGAFQSLVISVGTGTILAGIIKGLRELPTIYAVSCGMSIKRQKANVQRLLHNAILFWQPHVVWVEPQWNYYDAVITECPFPCSPYYDRKAWVWMLEHLESLSEPILFWNIGA